jgi:triosephosphate isomerase (TIM)
MKLPFICGNWKMYKTVADAVKYTKEFRVMVKDISDVEIVLAPTFTALHAAAEAARNSNVAIAAQDLYWEREGAFTGAISAPMIREAGAEYVIVGHSERRTLFGETDTTVNRKAVAAFAAGLTPIVCIGETLDQRERNETFDVLDRQIKLGLDGLTTEQMGLLVLAYEPVWAIGTGRNAHASDAAAMAGVIREALGGIGVADRGETIPILYGGSVSSANIDEFMNEPAIDGALVGGASLKPDEMAGIVARAGMTARARLGASGA